MSQAFDFITSKEVVICPWQKKPDVELIDPRGELLAILLDVTLRALFQQSIALDPSWLLGHVQLIGLLRTRDSDHARSLLGKAFLQQVDDQSMP